MTSPTSPTPPRYDDLRALFINCTLKRSPEVSNTEGLIERSRAVMEANGVATSRSSGPSTTTSPPASGRT